MLDCVIDLSRWNTLAPDPATALERAREAGIAGVILKATQGVTGGEACFAPRWNVLAQSALLRGAYHFGTGTDGVAQAEHFLATVAPRAGDLLALDFEKDPSGPDMTIAQAEAFVSRVQAQTGRWPVFYTGPWWISEQLAGRPSAILGHCPLWLAEYGPTPRVPSLWSDWTLWQQTSTANVAGISPCDRSLANFRDPSAFVIWWRGTP